MQLKDKLLKKMEGPKQMDPFMILPPEIAAMILEHFSFRQMVYVFSNLLTLSTISEC